MVTVSPESRSPAFLAALASAAVPGLEPVSARAVHPGRTAEFDSAVVIDDQDRSWFIRCPRTPAAGARLESAAALVALLARRLPFQVPVPKGFVAVPDGRAAVYPLLPGRPLAFAGLPSGPGLAAELGRTIAAIHNVDRGVYEEAGVPSYDADAYRTRRLADLDRAAATGHVPTALLSRWESALDDVTLWRFAPAPVHGGLTRSQVLAVFDSDDDAGSGHVRAVVGWEDARVADPAEDFAAVVTTASPGAVESVLEAYANSRIERPDPHLRRRALLASELGLLGELLAAVTLGVPDRVRAVADRLTQLSRQVEPDDLKAPAPVAVTPKEVPVPRDRTGAAPATSAADLGSLEDTAAMAGPGGSAATDQLALVTDQDTVAMDPRMMFDATEEIPPEQLQAVRQAHAARETSRDETDRASEDAAEPEELKTGASKAEAAKAQVTEVAE